MHYVKNWHENEHGLVSSTAVTQLNRWMKNTFMYYDNNVNYLRDLEHESQAPLPVISN